MIRGEIYYADLSPTEGSEQGGYRPVLIIQNDKGNKHSTTTIIAPISCRMTKHPIPTHVIIKNSGLDRVSVILLEQIRIIDKSRLGDKIGIASNYVMKKVDDAIKISLDIK